MPTDYTDYADFFIICITLLQNLVFIPRFFLRHLRIAAAIIGWGCHPLCVNLCNLWALKIKNIS
jgi:hypothetical protein